MQRQLVLLTLAPLLWILLSLPSPSAGCCDPNPCAVHRCPKYPASKCRYNCGECKAIYYTDDGTISDRGCIKIVPCPRGTFMHRCPVRPCETAECPAVKDAICIDNYCGGCKYDFYYQGQILSPEKCIGGGGPSLCPSWNPPSKCDKNPCDGATCPGSTGARCVVPPCGKCRAEFVNSQGRVIEERYCVKSERCPPHVPQAGCACAKPPCECLGQTCPLVKGAKCKIDGCGGCNVVFFDGRRRLTKEDCEGCGGSFPPRIGCNPCSTATCPLHRGARCEARRCGQCKAVFFGKDRKEIKKCCENKRCRDGSLRFHCKSNPCTGAVCHAFPGATCKPNYCGGCKAEFHINGVKLQEEDCVIKASCLPCHGGICLNCADTCKNAVCAGYPDARCVAEKCGSCKPIFYDANLQVIQNCGSPTSFCSDGSRLYTCPRNPCDGATCPRVRNARCTPDFCGGCTAKFYYESGARIPDYRCVLEDCPADVFRAKCRGDMCEGNKCPMVKGAECHINGCGGCNLVFYKGRKRLTDEDCNGCPIGKRKMECGDVCKDALCPLYPDARCEARVCGECRAVFYGKDRQEIKDCCGTGVTQREESPCPPDVPLVACAVDPCSTASCPTEPLAECRANFCGECNAEFFLGDRKLSNVDCGLCENGKAPINCGIVPQCMFSECKAYPDAICRSTNCGECREWFEDSSGNVVDCNAVVAKKCKIPPPIPNGIRRMQSSTFRVGDVVRFSCKEGYTLKGSATRKCVLRKGVPVVTGATARCVDKNECGAKPRPCHILAACTNKPGSYFCTCRFGYLGDAVNDCSLGDYRCPRITGLGYCVSNCKTNGDCGFGQICCSNGCAMRCTAKQSTCPPGSPLTQCYSNPCLFRTCPRYPEALCLPNYCGGCFAEFYMGDTKIEDCYLYVS